MTAPVITDPIERIIADALTMAGIAFVHESQAIVWPEFPKGPRRGLDFWLPDDGLFIECKAYHSDRIARQTTYAENIIVIQGKRAAQAFARLITANRPTPTPPEDDEHG